MLSVLSDLYGNVNCTTFFLALFGCLAFWILIQWSRSYPGPVGLPYVGYYPFLRDDHHVQLQEMTKKYGNIFCLKCTGQLFVHLNTVRAVREAHVTKSDCFGKRISQTSYFTNILGDGFGFTNDEKWKVFRKFFVQSLKEIGLGKKSQEGLIGNNIHKIVSLLRECNGRTVDVLELFTRASTEAILHMLVGGVKMTKEDVDEISYCFKNLAGPMGNRVALISGPLYKILMHIMPQLRRCQKWKHQMESILHKIVQQHEKEFSKDNLRDLVDYYICERRVLKEKGDSKYKMFTDRALVSTVVQFFGDGSLSIGLLTAAILMELARNPDVQKKIQQELDEVVGRNRFPSYDDRSKTPYTSAAIYEGMRTSDFFPIFPSLECTKETSIEGCRVPKGTVTLVNFWAILHDPDTYPEPEKFDPTRFLASDGKKSRSELPIIFGIGKRACTGEPLTMMEMYLFISTVLQNFSLQALEENRVLPPGAKSGYEEEAILLRVTIRQS